MLNIPTVTNIPQLSCVFTGLGGFLMGLLTDRFTSATAGMRVLSLLLGDQAVGVLS